MAAQEPERHRVVVPGGDEKYAALLTAYRAELGDMLSFSQRVEQLMTEEYDGRVAAMEQKLTVAKEAVWLYEEFGDGEYRDVLGLCKAASLADIEEKGWSLTPGAYVGVAPVEDDGVDFAQRMREIHRELLELQKESNELMETISRNWEGMGL